MFLTIKSYLDLNYMLVLNWIVWNKTVFSTLKLYLHLTELLHITATVFDIETVFKLN